MLVTIPTTRSMLVTILTTILLFTPARTAVAQCPWGRDPNLVELQSACLCAINLSQQLSVQCSVVNFDMLTSALYDYAREAAIDLVYVNNSAIVELKENTFKGLKISNLQISNAKISKVSPNAFRGLEDTLQGLNLADNELTEVPVETLRTLRLLSSLDLTNNQIQYVPNNAFVTIRLKTLKLSDNNVTLADGAFNGLEQSLKNLNLKGCQLKSVPKALANLAGLAFLDLAQNSIRDLGSGDLSGLSSLTALNLERNVIQKLSPSVFYGINDTVSSLSLLNNLLTSYPTQAITSLAELRVLDLGFNLLRSLPSDAFSGISSLTLLALDGNPMSSLPEEAFRHLNSSLRGLSLGGRFLTCDCKIRWITTWIRKYDLQVTSRERNPQFCGNPQELRERSFYQLNEKDLVCATPLTTQPSRRYPPPPPTTTTLPPPVKRFPSPALQLPPEVVVSSSQFPQPERTSQSSPRLRQPSPFPDNLVRSSPPSYNVKPKLSGEPGDIITEIRMEVGQGQGKKPSQTKTVSVGLGLTGSGIRRNQGKIPLGRGSTVITRRGEGDSLPGSQNTIPRSLERTSADSQLASRPNDLVLRPGKETLDTDSIAPEALVEDVIVREAYKERNSIVIKWESETTNILGFRVIYRLFGTPQFKQGPPLAPSEREFKIKNVPENECIVVCVVSLEEVEITPSNVPFEQCREIRTEGVGGSKRLDNIIIPASTAIVVCVIVAVIIFIACLKTSNKKSNKMLDEKPIHTLSMSMNGLNLAGMAPGPPGAPLAGLASLGLGPSAKDWDQMSMYSQKTDRSVNRARMYHMDPRQQGSMNAGYIPDDARSHISQFSTRSRSRSLADGRSEHGLFGQGQRYPSRNDLRASRQSLADDGRRSRASALQRSMMRKSTRQSTRSRSRDKLSNTGYRDNRSRDGDRGSSGYRSRDGDSLPDSDNWATSTDNNWTDYDQDVYTVRSPQKNRYSRDDVNL